MTHTHVYLDRFYYAVAALIVCTVINLLITLNTWRRRRRNR